MVEEQLRKIKKSKLFTLFPYTATQIHTHTHFFLLLYTRKKNDCKRALAKNHYESCCSDKQNTLGAPSSQERDFFLRGNISYSKHQNLSCGQHPKKALLD